MSGTVPRLLLSVARRLSRVYSIIILAALWQGATQAQLVPPLFLPPLNTVFEILWRIVLSGEALQAIGTSLERASAGLFAAIVVGVMAGLAMSQSRTGHWALEPFVAAGFPTPKIAFIPIFTLWFGIDDTSKILLVAFTCVFVVVISTAAAATGVPRRLVWSAQALGTGRSAILWRIILPASLPQLFTGVRVCVPVALITAFTAEMISGGGGAGTELMYAQRFFDTPVVYAYIILMLGTGFLLDIALVALQRRLFPWDAEVIL